MQSLATSTTRVIAIVGLFSASYIISAGLVSSLFGDVARGYPEHFLHGVLMTAVVVGTGKKWSATIMGIVCGIVFGIVVPAPARYLLASTIVSGLVFDLALMGGPYKNAIRSFSRIVVGAAVSGVAESLVALSILTFASFFGNSVEILASAWSVDISLNIVFSSVGAVLTFNFLIGRNSDIPIVRL
ncbi:MAG: hypothetical protein JRN52_03400 [Nitrososphaerota archaeon]|nr:hypothetical protein [Nitrososphaerota archaeon]